MSVRVLLLIRNSERSINLVRMTGNRCCRHEQWQKTYFYLFIIINIIFFLVYFEEFSYTYRTFLHRIPKDSCAASICGRRDNIFDHVSYRFRRRTDVLRIYRIIKYYRKTCFLHFFFFFFFLFFRHQNIYL